MPFKVRWLMARLMDGEIVQNYLHATGGTGFYIVLPLEGAIHTETGHTRCTQRHSKPRATHRHAKRVFHGRNKAADPTSRKTSSPSLTRVGASMILDSGSGSSPSHLNHFRFQASKH
ncbi:uncharacterized protein Bfra_006645 [Botrytis fragariae]|uniref:Uncharacterized protein n=1 Tax=Botrytis fragariae TaxID=1964551 RepID=A0A8H6EP18_9HELO|nr:uncharacterized protein Bfra_006645 [Botrytis fragariae]KAF5879436.1 hypothetical protein Bfra_006645 [Botrytis fragariae]